MLALLKEEGLKTGIFKIGLDLSKIEAKMRLRKNEISFISIEIKGTNAIIDIVDKVEKPEIINEEEICNIISNKDGIITKINVKSGTAQVKENSVITKGDILVLGLMESEKIDTRYVHSEADIQAKVWYAKSEEFLLATTIKANTGKIQKKYSITFKDFKINLFKNNTKFLIYDKITTENKLKLMKNLYLPIVITTDTYYEQKENESTYEEQELLQMAIEKLTDELKQEIPEGIDILDTKVNYNSKENGIFVEVILEILESVGLKEKLTN